MKKWIAMLMLVLMLFSTALAEEPMGGWTVSDDPAITDETMAVFQKALEGLTGAVYTPVAYLGSQVVAGTNRCFLCQVTGVYPGAQPSYVLLYLYEDLQGNASILSVSDLDIGSLCTYGAES